MAVAQSPAVEPSVAPSAGAARHWWPDLLAVGAIVVGLVILWTQFGRLSPQAEFVDWTYPRSALASELAHRLLDVFSFNHIYHTRTLSLGWVIASSHACGSSVGCLNAFAFVPVVVAALGLFAAGRVLGLPAFFAFAVVAVLLASEPTFDVMVWQATIHDRMANAATWITVIVFFLAARYARRSWASAVPWTLGLSLVGLAAMHTKESAWPLLALAATAPLLLATGRRQRITTALVFALPVALMLADAITQYLVAQEEPHVSGGDLAHDLRVLTEYVVPGGLTIATVVVGLAFGAAAYVVARWRTAPQAFAVLRAAAWIAIAAVCGWLIPARTAIPVPFYMFVPLATAALAVALAFRAAFLALPADARGVYRYGFIAAGTAVALWFVLGAVTGRFGTYGDQVDANASFWKTFGKVAAIREAHPQDQVQFRTPGELPYAYRFVTASRATDLFRLRGAQQPVDETYATGTSAPACGTNGVLVITLDNKLQPISTC